MSEARWWLALVTFERRDSEQEILPDWAWGGCGWMVAAAPDEDTARDLLVRDVTQCGLRVLKVADVREFFDDDEVEVVDDHLAENFREIESGKQTVWGSIHGYKGEGDA